MLTKSMIPDPYKEVTGWFMDDKDIINTPGDPKGSGLGFT